MESLFNLHTHCQYCDGSDEPEAYIKAALKAGFHTLGFSSHAPVPFKNNFAIRDKTALSDYCLEIRHLSRRYQDQISIYLALELDYISGMTMDFKNYKDAYGLDYTIGSVHLVKNHHKEDLWFIDGPKSESYDRGLQDIFGGDARMGVRAYYDQINEMLLSQKPDIIGHFDKIKMHNRNRYFSDDDPWYRSLVIETLEIIRQTGVIVEVNTRGIYKKRSPDLYPGKWILEEILKRNLPITISSDAHKPEEIDGYYAETISMLKETGFQSLLYYSDEGWKEQTIDHGL